MQSCSCSQHEGVWWSGGIAPYHFSPRCWRWAVNWTPRPLYLRGKCSRCSLAGSLSGFQKRCACFRKRNNTCPCVTSNQETPDIRPLAWSIYRYFLQAPWTDMAKIMRTFWNFFACDCVRNATQLQYWSWCANISLSLCFHSGCRTVPCSYASRSLSLFHFVVVCSPFFFTAYPTSKFLWTSTFHSLL